MKKLRSLTIFFPFYNDEGTVEKAISDAYKYGKQVANKIEIIAIHGGDSKDKTFEVIKKMQREYPKLIIVDKTDNWERYAVIKYGFQKAKGEWVFYTDGDLQYSLEDLKKLVSKQQETGTDVVNGFRTQRADDFIRVVPGNIYKVLARIIFRLPIRDLECDFRLIKNGFIKRIDLTAHNASILLELIKKLELVGARFAEVRVRHYHRRYGKSTYNPFILLWEKVSGDFNISRKLK